MPREQLGPRTVQRRADQLRSPEREQTQRYALITVTNKEGIGEFAKGLSDLGFIILSTGGTAERIREAGVETMEVSEYTGMPEAYDGRVKVLHPKVFGGILPDRNKAEHVAQALERGDNQIELVVVNFYDFKKDPSIKNMDIGGPALARAAAKNHEGGTIIVVDPLDYDQVLDSVRDNAMDPYFKLYLAQKAIAATAEYDADIATWMKERLDRMILENEIKPDQA